MIKGKANRKPPNALRINGNVYRVKVHYLNWIEIVDLLDEIDYENLFDLDADHEEDFKVMRKIEKLAFGEIINEDVFSVLEAITKFAVGYPRDKGSNTTPQSDGGHRQVVDFKYDLNDILVAIRNQSGINLIATDDVFHWWLFLLEFENLCGDHRICKIMELRGYEGKDKDMIKARDAVALPKKMTKAERKFEEEMAELFYNC